MQTLVRRAGLLLNLRIPLSRRVTYCSGRSPDWLKMKNPACEAVRREAEEDWENGCLARICG